MLLDNWRDLITEPDLGLLHRVEAEGAEYYWETDNLTNTQGRVLKKSLTYLRVRKNGTILAESGPDVEITELSVRGHVRQVTVDAAKLLGILPDRIQN